MSKLHILALRALRPDAQRGFYRRVLDMATQDSGGLGYSDREMNVRFVQSETSYRPQPTDLYWKIAVSVPNIELAYQQLVARGARVSVPHQFRDVGYLAHETDPEGFTVELIEHWFQGDRPSQSVDKTLLGGRAAHQFADLADRRHCERRTRPAGGGHDTTRRAASRALRIHTLLLWVHARDAPRSGSYRD